MKVLNAELNVEALAQVLINAYGHKIKPGEWQNLAVVFYDADEQPVEVETIKFRVTAIERGDAEHG